MTDASFMNRPDAASLLKGLCCTVDKDEFIIDDRLDVWWLLRDYETDQPKGVCCVGGYYGEYVFYGLLYFHESSYIADSIKEGLTKFDGYAEALSQYYE